jgi:small-conductance mechanosensitive channel
MEQSSDDQGRVMDAASLNVVLNVVTVLLGGTLLGVILRYRLGVRKMALGEEANIRDHYAGEVAALRAEINQQERNFREVETHLRGLLAASDRRHEECEAARADSRREIEGLHREIEGMRRQMVRYSAEGVLVLSEQKPSALVEEAARRVKGIVEEGGERR